MFATFKMIAITAAVSAAIVTAYDLPSVRANSETGTKTYYAKTYYDRVLPSEPANGAKVILAVAAVPTQSSSAAAGGKGDSLRATDPNCAAQAWPNVARECLIAEVGTPVRKAVRTITIEKREGANTSVLVPVPSAEIASR